MLALQIRMNMTGASLGIQSPSSLNQKMKHLLIRGLIKLPPKRMRKRRLLIKRRLTRKRRRIRKKSPRSLRLRV